MNDSMLSESALRAKIASQKSLNYVEVLPQILSSNQRDARNKQFISYLRN